MKCGDAVGRYRIESQLGGGGMGVVYLAEDLTLGRKADSDGRNVVELSNWDRIGFPLLTYDDRHVVFLSSANGIQTPWIMPRAGRTIL